MNKLLIIFFGLMIFVLNIAVATESRDAHTHDTENIGHQFYDALITTPKDALVNAGTATKDLAVTVANSDAAQDLKHAGKQLVVDAPVKTGHALHNSAKKAYEVTASGAQTVYEKVVIPPAQAIKEKAQEVANSELVQNTKETVKDIAHRITQVSSSAFNSTANGIKKAYHVAIEEPVGAIKNALHNSRHNHSHNHACSYQKQLAPEVYVFIVETPLVDAQTGLVKNGHTAATSCENKEETEKIVVVVGASKSPILAFNLKEGVLPSKEGHLPAQNPNVQLTDAPHLSNDALLQIALAYEAIHQELSSPQ